MTNSLSDIEKVQSQAALAVVATVIYGFIYFLIFHKFVHTNLLTSIISTFGFVFIMLIVGIFFIVPLFRFAIEAYWNAVNYDKNLRVFKTTRLVQYSFWPFLLIATPIIFLQL